MPSWSTEQLSATLIMFQVQESLMDYVDATAQRKRIASSLGSILALFSGKPTRCPHVDESHGFHATGIDRIISEADVAKMTMYRHFPSKDGLIVEVLDYRARRFEHQLDHLAEQAAEPEQKITTIFGWYGRWFGAPDFHGCLFAHALAEFGEPDHPYSKPCPLRRTA
jgi:AcrR family transcriptional regulator